MSNSPRIIYNGDDFANPSFEGQGNVGSSPLLWSKDTDGDDSSTFTKESGAHDTEIGKFFATLERIATDTRVIAFQDIFMPLTAIVIGDTLYFACWLRANTTDIAGEIRIETRTAADATIESTSESLGPLTVATGWKFFTLELPITTLASYDHVYVAVQSDTIGGTLNIDDCEFGKILDLPSPAISDLGVTTIDRIENVLLKPINSRSAFGAVESINPVDPFSEFDVEIRRFRLPMRLKLDAFWEWARSRGNHWYAFYLDKDNPDRVESYHYPYLIMANDRFAPIQRPGIVMYDVSISCEQVYPFEISS